MSTRTTQLTAHFLQGGGQMGALMRAKDWSDSPLGSPAAWPQALRTVVGIMLQSQFPMFVAWGPALGFLYNDPYVAVLGAKHPRALGRPFHDIWSEIWSDISPLIDSAMAGQATFHEDLPLLMNRHGYEEPTWFTFSYSPIRDGSGRVAGMFCACSETTGRVLAERRLRELNETLERRVSAALAERKLLADIVEGTDAFVQLVGLDYRWLAINRAAADEFERIFGVRPRVGDHMLQLLADQPAHQAEVAAVWARALAGEEFVETAMFGDPRRDRRAYEMRYRSLHDEQGRRIGAYQFVYDVTDRLRDQERLRQAQEALRQSQKMEALGQLTGGVAHDFNNLLAVFSNGLHLLERDVTGEQRERVLAAMRRAVARGTGLTHQLLSFSRRQAIHPQTIDLGTHLHGMRDLMARSLGGNVDVRIDLDPGLWPVKIDAGEFELAILNLCVNARDALGGEGTIRISARNGQAEPGEAPGEWVHLCVVDRGVGMTPEVLARATEPFYTTKDVGKGSGLGLAQVYGFAKQSAGRLVIDSRPGEGTVVTLVLPRSHEPPVAPVDTGRSSGRQGAGLSRGQVLVVEDDREVAALTREMLAEFGFLVVHAPDPDAALDALNSGRRIDAVLSDIMMPGGISGLTLAREIRRRHPAMRIVLTTGYADAAAPMEASEFALLLKPYSAASLARALGLSADA